MTTYFRSVFFALAATITVVGLSACATRSHIGDVLRTSRDQTAGDEASPTEPNEDESEEPEKPIEEAPDASAPTEPRPLSRLSVGSGFTLDPNMYYQSLSAEVYIRRNLTVGPEVAVGVSKDELYLSPTMNLTGYVDAAEDVRLYARGSVGAAYLEKDRRPGDDNDLALSLGSALGFRYQIREDFDLGLELGLSVFPGELGPLALGPTEDLR